MSENSQPSSTATIESLAGTAEVEPWDFYERLDAAGGVVWDDSFGAWLVTSYDLIREIALADDDLWEVPFVLDREREMPFGMTYEQWTHFFAWGSEKMIAATTGPEHEHQHRWWMRTFSPRTLARWRENLIRPIAHAQIDRFADRGRAELGTEFADRLAPRVMAAVMGLPHEDDAWLGRLAELNDRRMALKQLWGQAAVDPGLLANAFAATDEINAMLAPYVEERRSGEGDDFISMLWRDAAELFGEAWEEADIYSSTMAMWEGGAGSTPPSTSNGIYTILVYPELRDELRAGGSDGEKAIKNLVEEAMRLWGPVYHRPRVATRDAELNGNAIKKGDRVLTLMVAGSRDEAHYACPHAVDLHRKAPRDHFAFYVGPRTCPGQGLARVELEEAAAAILGRLDDLRLDPDQEAPRLSGLFMRRWEPLHAVFTPA
jgi:cytochrome P450